MSATWRAMTEADLPRVTEISALVHREYGETIEVYRERLALYPQGCFVFERDGEIVGLLVTHPWREGSPPKLNAPLGAIPSPATTYYLHDIALLPEARGTGAGAEATRIVTQIAREAGLPDVTLVAVNGADRFWATQGFEPVAGSEAFTYGPGTYFMRRTLA